MIGLGLAEPLGVEAATQLNIWVGRIGSLSKRSNKIKLCRICPPHSRQRGAVMDARRRDDDLLDEVSRLLEERRDWRDYMTIVLTLMSTKSEAGMRAGIGQLLKQLGEEGK